MLAPSSFSESNPLRWASIRVFKVISRRRRRLIDRWCCFSFPNRTHFIGLRFGSHQGANTVPFPPHGENCTMLAPSSFSESNPLRWASIRVFKVISRRRRRPIDRWCCFSFPNRTHFIGLRFGSHQGANTVPFPLHGENCTMLAPSSCSESNPLRWASIYFFYNKAGKHNLCLPAFAYSFGFPFLLFEKRYHNGAGARMGSDHTSYGRIANFFQVSFPDVTAVFDIF